MVNLAKRPNTSNLKKSREEVLNIKALVGIFDIDSIETSMRGGNCVDVILLEKWFLSIKTMAMTHNACSISNKTMRILSIIAMGYLFIIEADIVDSIAHMFLHYTTTWKSRDNEYDGVLITMLLALKTEYQRSSMILQHQLLMR